MPRSSGLRLGSSHRSLRPSRSTSCSLSEHQQHSTRLSAQLAHARTSLADRPRPPPARSSPASHPSLAASPMKRLFHKNKRSEAPTPTSTPPSDSQYAPAADSTASPPPHLAAAQHPGQGQQYAQPPGGQGFVPAQGGGGGLPRPPRVQDVGNAVGWSVAMPAFDWAYLLALSDHLSTSSSASKDATKALIAEFKHATPHAQQRAVHLTSLLWSNTNDRFKGASLLALSPPPTIQADPVPVPAEQVASKKFLASLTDLVADPSTPPQVKSMVYRVLSPLAFDAQSKSSLRPITEAFNRLLADPKTSLSSFPHELDPTMAAFQPNGAPLAPDDPLLLPEALLSQHGGSRRSRPRMERFPTGIEQMRDLGRRAVEGKSWAGMLSEAVALAKDEPNARNKGRGKRWEDMDTEEKEAAQARGEGPGGREDGDGHEVEVREGLEANEVVQVRLLSPSSTPRGTRTDPFARSPAGVPHALPRGAGLPLDQPRLGVRPGRAVSAKSRRRGCFGARSRRAPAGRCRRGAAPREQQPVRGGRRRRRGPGQQGRRDRGGGDPERDARCHDRGASTGSPSPLRPRDAELIFVRSLVSQISDALHLYALRLSHSRQTQQEDAELAAAIDRSRSDDHFNRFKHDEPEVDYAHGEGGSGAPSRDPFGDVDGLGEAPQPQHDKGKARESLNPYSSYLDSAASHPPPAPAQAYSQPQPSQPSVASPYDGLEALEGLGGLSFSSSPAAPASGRAGEQYDDFGSSPARPTSGGFSSSNPYASYSSQPGGLRERSDSAFLREYVPEQPSQKALGKIRRVSQGAGTLLSSLSLSLAARRSRSELELTQDCSHARSRRPEPRGAAAPARGRTAREVRAQLPRGAGAEGARAAVRDRAVMIVLAVRVDVDECARARRRGEEEDQFAQSARLICTAAAH